MFPLGSSGSLGGAVPGTGAAVLSLGGSMIAAMVGFGFWVNNRIPGLPGPFPQP